MASLYISEYTATSTNSGQGVPVMQEPGTDQSPVSISGSHAESAAFGTNTRWVRVHTDAICSVKFGSAPVATANNKRMIAGQTEYWAVFAGDKISVITNT